MRIVPLWLRHGFGNFRDMATHSAWLSIFYKKTGKLSAVF